MERKNLKCIKGATCVAPFFVSIYIVGYSFLKYLFFTAEVFVRQP